MFFLNWSDGDCRKRGPDDDDGDRTLRAERHAQGLGGRQTPPVRMPGGTAVAPPQKHRNEVEFMYFLDWSNGDHRKRRRDDADSNRTRRAERHVQGLGERETPPVHMPSGTAAAPPQKHMSKVDWCVFSGLERRRASKAAATSPTATRHGARSGMPRVWAGARRPPSTCRAGRRCTAVE